MCPDGVHECGYGRDLLRVLRQVGILSYQAAREFVDDWLEAPNDGAARFVFHAGLARAWARLTPEERVRLRAEVEPLIPDPLRAEEWAGLPD